MGMHGLISFEGIIHVRFRKIKQGWLYIRA